MQRYLIAAAIILTTVLGFTINVFFEARALLYSYRSENAYLRSQIEAQQRDINSLQHEQYYLRELVRRK